LFCPLATEVTRSRRYVFILIFAPHVVLRGMVGTVPEFQTFGHILWVRTTLGPICCEFGVRGHSAHSRFLRDAHPLGCTEPVRDPQFSLCRPSKSIDQKGERMNRIHWSR
jgi:hypothetical protein